MQFELEKSNSISGIGIMHLKRYWQKAQLRKSGELSPDAFPKEWTTDITLLAALGLGLEQTIKHLFEANESFEEFENWIMQVNHQTLSLANIETFNKTITDTEIKNQTPGIENVLSETDLQFWNENGYIILKNAVSKQDCENTIQVICDFINVDVQDAATWYKEHPAKQGIMVQLFQHP